MKSAPRRLSALLILALAAACGRPLPDASPLHDNGVFEPALGEAYDVASDRMLDLGCVAWDPALVEVDPPADGTVTYQTNVDFEQIREIVSGQAHLKIDLESFDISGEVDYASEFKKSNFVTSISVYMRIENGRARLLVDSGKVRLNQTGEELAQAFDLARFRRVCGTHFVHEKTLGGVFVGALIFKFANLTDKMRFDARVSVDIANFGGGSAEVKAILNKLSENASIRFRAYQEGGVPTELTQALSSHMADCSADDREPCYKAFDEMRDYLATRFPAQFRIDGKLEPTRFALRDYRYAPYSALSDPRLTTQAVSESDIAKLVAVRNQISALVVDDKSTQKQARALLDGGAIRNEAHVLKVKLIIDNLDRRLETYRRAAEDCVGPDALALRCETTFDEVKEAIERFPVNHADLVVTAHTLEDYCVKLKAWFEAADPAIATQIMDSDTRAAVLAIMNTPQLKAAAGGGREVIVNARSVLDATRMSIDHTELNCQTYGSKAYLVSKLSLIEKHLGNVEALTALSNVRTLELSHNRFPGGVPALGQLPYLQKVVLSHSKLKALDGLGIATLRELDLTDNWLEQTELPKLAGAKLLEKLTLADNDRILDATLLPGLPKLNELDLRGTKTTRGQALSLLERINGEGGAPKDLPRLQKLYLPASACESLIVLPSIEIVCE